MIAEPGLIHATVDDVDPARTYISNPSKYGSIVYIRPCRTFSISSRAFRA